MFSTFHSQNRSALASALIRFGILLFCVGSQVACSNATQQAFAAFQACQQQLSTADTLKEVDCLDASATPEGIDEQRMLEHWQGMAAIPWALARGVVQENQATLRLIATDSVKPNEGFTAELVNDQGRWLVSNIGIKVVDFGSETFGTGTLRLQRPHAVSSDHAVSGVTRAGPSVAYGLHDLWGEAAVEIQSKTGPLTVGNIEYEYHREAFTEPPVLVTIRLGIYDDQRFSYKHGGTIDIQSDNNGLLQGTFDLWAEKRDGERAEISGTFVDLPADGKDVFGG